MYSRCKDGFGRAFVSKALGLTAFSKKVRNTFIHNLYYDFDLCNAQPAIVENLCKANNIPCPMISQYCNNREQILQEIMKCYNVKRNEAKTLMLRLCFFGKVQGWKRDNNITSSDDLPFLIMFSDELVRIAETVKKHNLDLYEIAREKKEAKKRKIILAHSFQNICKIMRQISSPLFWSILLNIPMLPKWKEWMFQLQPTNLTA